MKVFVTGGSGYLGSRLAAHWREKGAAVVAASRRDLTLGQPFHTEIFNGVDLLIHCAHDFTHDSNQAAFAANVEGTRALYDAARTSGVARQIFISSYSARADALTEYGRVKYALEQFFLSKGETVVRPGVVIGYGGMFGRNMDLLLRLPLIPLLNGGVELIPVIGIRDFVTAVDEIVEGCGPGGYNIFEPELVPMEKLVRTLNRLAGHHALYFSVSTAIAMGFLAATAKLGIRIPVVRSNLEALRQNQQTVYTSDFAGGSSLDEILRAAIEERSRIRAVE
jgi:nucleoside-diphosphate-sugar epimerase